MYNIKPDHFWVAWMPLEGDMVRLTEHADSELTAKAAELNDQNDFWRLMDKEKVDLVALTVQQLAAGGRVYNYNRHGWYGMARSQTGALLALAYARGQWQEIVSVGARTERQYDPSIADMLSPASAVVPGGAA